MHAISVVGEVQPPAECLKSHVSVLLNDSILILCGSHGYSCIYIYNLWTEHWNRHRIPRALPITGSQCGVAIGTEVYLFGGHIPKYMFWKLIKCTDPHVPFDWEAIYVKDNGNMPSPRTGHCAWEHDRKLWIFGGYGPSPNDYLHKHGEFKLDHFWGWNNQLLSYSPCMKTWNNVECIGEVPEPQSQASSAIIKDRVWLYGSTGVPNELDLYELHMNSLQWTRIESTMPKPVKFGTSSLSVITNNKLLLHGGYGESNKNFTWIFDVQLQAWRQHIVEENHLQWDYTGTTGLTSSVIIFGGNAKHGTKQQVAFSVMLEPKSLQQSATKTIYQCRQSLPWDNLPNKLIHKMMDM